MREQRRSVVTEETMSRVKRQARSLAILAIQATRIVRVALFTAAMCVALPVDGARAGDGVLVHHPVSTHNATAQLEFDRGLSLVYAFNPEEAIYHFERALDADSHLAMAYWGIALCAGPNVNTPYDLGRARIGREAVAAAENSTNNASDAERRYISALKKRYAADSPAEILGSETAYADAMGEVARYLPNDVDAETLYAESLMDLTPLQMWLPGDKPNRYTNHVIAILDDVLRRDPSHVGANHYLIHAYEYSRTPQLALSSARRLAALDVPPAAEHLAHMPDHIFLRLGDYSEAIASGERAVALFRTYLRQQHSNVHDGYFHHDLQVLDYAYMMAGRWAQAHATADEIASQVSDPGAAVETYLRFHRYRELLALTPATREGVRWRYATGIAEAKIGNLATARSALQSLSNGPHDDARNGIARDLLSAAIEERERRDDAAISDLRHAVTLQDSLALSEPPKWFYPVRESLGGRLLRAHRDGEAREVFDEDLRRNPDNPRSLFGLSLALAKTDARRSRELTAAFEKAWRGADATLTVDML